MQAGAQFQRSWCYSSICKPLRVGGNRIDIDDIGECGMNCFRITNALALARSLNHSLKGLGWLVACIFFVFALPTRSLARSLTHSLANSLTYSLTRRSPSYRRRLKNPDQLKKKLKKSLISNYLPKLVILVRFLIYILHFFQNYYTKKIFMIFFSFWIFLDFLFLHFLSFYLFFQKT